MRTRLLLLLAIVVPLAIAEPAAASSKQEVTFEAPRDLYFDPATRNRTFQEISDFGVRSLRVILTWRKVAPKATSRIRPSVDLSDPASYDWSLYQGVLDEAKARGFKVLLTVSTPAPTWATKGARDDVTRPSTTRFREFVIAVSRQFGGNVTRYSFINEPNLPQFLKPQYVKGKVASPAIYRGLYDAGLRGLKETGDTKPVLMGETAPNGAPPRTVAPVTFLRGALCLNSKYKRKKGCLRMRVDGWAHHAYARKTGPLASVPTRLVTIGTLSRLTSALNRAAKVRAVKKSLPVHVTEFGIQSYPDRTLGVSLTQQNEYRAISEKIAYENGRVATFAQYLMTDDAAGKGKDKYGGFESGLRTTGGKAKPAYDGFRLPVVAERRGSRVNLWGLVRPAAGRENVTVERRSGGGSWKKIFSTITDSRGKWTGRSMNVKRGSWRVIWVGADGVTYRSPGVRAYTWPKRLR